MMRGRQTVAFPTSWPRGMRHMGHRAALPMGKQPAYRLCSGRGERERKREREREKVERVKADTMKMKVSKSREIRRERK